RRRARRTLGTLARPRDPHGRRRQRPQRDALRRAADAGRAALGPCGRATRAVPLGRRGRRVADGGDWRPRGPAGSARRQGTRGPCVAVRRGEPAPRHQRAAQDRRAEGAAPCGAAHRRHPGGVALGGAAGAPVTGANRNDRLPLAIVGAGLWGANHARALLAHPGVRIALVCDSDEARARALADTCGCAWTTDLDAAARADVVAATVATPDHLHAGPTLAMLRAGKHVLVEKPLATTTAEAQTMVDAAESRGLKL